MKKITSLLAVLGLAALAAACSKDAKNEPAKAGPAATGDPATDPSGPAAAAPANAADQAPTLQAVFAEYEAIRSALANDTGTGVAAHASRIAELARGLGPDASPRLPAVAEAAAKLAAADQGDLAALRVAFGDLSRELVAVMESDAALAAGYHTFECPMAKGYGRWIQPTAELENPYMGQKMLACGSEVPPQGK